MKRLLNFAFICIGMLITGFILLPRVQEKIAINWIALQALQSISGQKTDRVPRTDILPKNCRAYWFAGLAAQSQGDIMNRNEQWVKAIQCDPGLVVYLHALFPEDPQMASLA
ncbi:MAG: hypothetical protein JW963_21345, partial [Anaerolineales bacterium]|nr:hypothetical protein [Anaerolineales bacterium]